MGARRKKTTRKKTTRRMTPLQRLEQELPRTLREFRKGMRTRLARLEKEVGRAQLQARRRAARLLRQASHQLGQLEAKGESGWRKLAKPYRRDLVRLIRRMEGAVKPRPAARKKTGRKKASARA